MKQRPIYPKKYDVFKLNNPETKAKFEIEIGRKFSPLLDECDTDVETLWENVKSSFHAISKKILGYNETRQQDPWISEEVLHLSEERKKVKQEQLSDPNKRKKYNFLNREIKRKTQNCKNKWIQDQCKKVENAHQAATSKEVYTTIKQITKKSSIKLQAIKHREGHILTEMEEVKQWWKENYEELYNTQSPADDGKRDIFQTPSCDHPPYILRE